MTRDDVVRRVARLALWMPADPVVTSDEEPTRCGALGRGGSGHADCGERFAQAGDVCGSPAWKRRPRSGLPIVPQRRAQECASATRAAGHAHRDTLATTLTQCVCAAWQRERHLARGAGRDDLSASAYDDTPTLPAMEFSLERCATVPARDRPRARRPHRGCASSPSMGWRNAMAPLPNFTPLTPAPPPLRGRGAPGVSGGLSTPFTRSRGDPRALSSSSPARGERGGVRGHAAGDHTFRAPPRRRSPRLIEHELGLIAELATSLLYHVQDRRVDEQGHLSRDAGRRELRVCYAIGAPRSTPRACRAVRSVHQQGRNEPPTSTWTSSTSGARK